MSLPIAQGSSAASLLLRAVPPPATTEFEVLTCPRRCARKLPTQVPVAPPVPTPRKPALPKSYGRPPHFLPDAQEITAALSATLTPEEGAWIATKPTDDPQAYAYYLRARTVLLETIGDLRQAVAYLDTALSLDSTFAGAWAQ